MEYNSFEGSMTQHNSLMISTNNDSPPPVQPRQPTYENHSIEVLPKKTRIQSRHSRANSLDLQRSVTPGLPPKQNRTTVRDRNKQNHLVTKSISDGPNSFSQPVKSMRSNQAKEGLYISHSEIESFPDPQPNQFRTIPPRILTNRSKSTMSANYPHNTDTYEEMETPFLRTKPPVSPVHFSSEFSSLDEHSHPSSPFLRPITPQPFGFSQLEEQFEEGFSSGPNSLSLDLNTDNIDTAIYGVTQGRGPNFVMSFTKIQSKLQKLYKKIKNEDPNSPIMAELKMYLGLPEPSTSDKLLSTMHSSLAPPVDETEEKERTMFVLDFCDFEDKTSLKNQIVSMFAKPGPPSISFRKVDAKMLGIIVEFCQRTEDLRTNRNGLIQSPAYARMIMQDIPDHNSLVKVLRENELWIRWGTPTFLPHLPHLYMHKHPPTYEVRKAVTISYIAEKQRVAPHMFQSIISPDALCPPIYSRLKSELPHTIKWQMTEYNDKVGKFESSRCKFPTWLEEDKTLKSFLHSSNRSQFTKGAHPYALYSVYLIVIKDFTLAQTEQLEMKEAESWVTPSPFQYYIGSSSTGVLFKFCHVSNNHCSRAWTVLHEAEKLRHFRCYQGCDLIEASLALSWIRRQPRAVFVLNSFLNREMSNLSLDRKKPYHDKMVALESHLAEGKKLGPLFDMRYGMNGTTTIKDEELD